LLEDMNPQYRLNIIPYDDKSNPLYLPGEIGEKFIEKGDSIYTYKDSVFFDDEYLQKQPARFAYNYKTGGSKKAGVKSTHTVRPGENLGLIARKYGCTVSQIKGWNNIDNDVIQSGQKLIVCKPKVTTRHKETPTQEVASKGPETKQVKQKTTELPKEEPRLEPKSDAKIVYYKVRPGDTLWAITQKYPGVTESDIIKLNGLKNANSIMAGMKLKIKLKA